MNRTLNQLIESAVLGGEEAEQASPKTIEVVQEKTASATSTADFEDVEKLASALEFLGRRGVASILEKQAMEKTAKCGKCGKGCPSGSKSCPHCGAKMEKQAGVHGDGNVGTNASTMHKGKGQSQVGPHKGAPPVAPGRMSGQVENNEGSKPGGGAAQAETGSTETGTHASELASNEAAIGYDKKSKTQRTSTALKKVLNTTPYADGKLKENLSNAGGKGDKNINKSAHDKDAVRAELERRAAARGGM